MDLIIICTALVVFMPLIAKVPVAFEMKKLGKYDNQQPRLQQSQLSGFGARAMAAHNNCFEAIAYYAPTVILVVAMDSHTVYTVYLCLSFVILRVLYVLFYWFNKDILRSLVWIMSMLTIVGHYILLLS